MWPFPTFASSERRKPEPRRCTRPSPSIPALFMSPVKEPKFFLCDGPPTGQNGPGDAHSAREWVWQREDYEALFDGAPEGALLGESTPLYLADSGAHQRMRRSIPDVEAHRDPARPGGPGVLELDAPLVRRAGAGRRLRDRVRAGGGPAASRGGRRSGSTAGSACTASSCSTSTSCSRGSRCTCSGTRSSWTRRATTLNRISDFLDVEHGRRGRGPGAERQDLRASRASRPA